MEQRESTPQIKAHAQKVCFFPFFLNHFISFAADWQSKILDFLNM